MVSGRYPLPGTLRHPGMRASPSSKLTDAHLHFHRFLTRLSSRLFPRVGNGGEGVDCLLISLPASKERRRALLARMDPGGWRLSAIDACHPAEASSLDDGEWARFHGMAERLRPGQRGCFLSHRRAWLRARESKAGLSVILEDDAVPLYGKAPPLPALPEDLDLLYLHHFAQRIPTTRQVLAHLLRAPLQCLTRPFRVFPIDTVLHSHCGRVGLGAMPASAYAVTPRGADKLLSLFDDVGNYDHWDAVVLRHSTSERTRARMLPDIQSDSVWFYRGQRPDRAWSKRSSITLNAYAIYPPLFLHDHRAPSVKLAVRDATASPGGEAGSDRTHEEPSAEAAVRDATASSNGETGPDRTHEAPSIKPEVRDSAASPTGEAESDRTLEAPPVKLTVRDPMASPGAETGSFRTHPLSAQAGRLTPEGRAGEAGRTAQTWLLCGIPRSGNGLCCRLADKLPDTVALSQPYDPRWVVDGVRFGSLPRTPQAACGRLDEFAAEVRRQIRHEGRAPSHQVGGGLYDNIMASGRSADSGLRERRGEWASVAIDKPLSERFTLFMSQPSVFSALLPELAEHFACLALVRNPLSLLASWQTVNLPFNRGRIAGAEPYDPKLRRALDEEPERLRRQLIILEWFFARYHAHLERNRVIRYEDLVESGGMTLFRGLGHERVEPVVLKSRNESGLYDGATVDALLGALLASGGAWTHFYRASDLERAAEGIRRP